MTPNRVKERYEVFVSKDSFKFNAAHFMAYAGFRERLHGHNYHVAVRVEGRLAEDGYVVDFGDIKTATRAICAEINERMIIPMQSDCIKVCRDAGQIELRCDDGSVFTFPDDDCVMLPIVQSSAEELASYVCRELVARLEVLRERQVTAVEVSVAEVPLQEARYRLEL